MNEWITKPDGKLPYYISGADGGVLSFGGLWDRWKNPETGEPLTLCTIIVADANALTRPVNDRMPVILDRGYRALAERYRGYRASQAGR
ncbi:MAG TPA: SOS response-associated peptidase family protein [Xanthobacteraceae bacterium]|nr:SOS response-associated peptidase family protein [Xanthobacteraceae bacterium]